MNVSLQNNIRLSFPGMAHWAATGPANETCEACQHFTPKHTCAMFSRLMQRTGPKVPRNAKACKFFETRK